MSGSRYCKKMYFSRGTQKWCIFHVELKSFTGNWRFHWICVDCWWQGCCQLLGRSLYNHCDDYDYIYDDDDGDLGDHGDSDDSAGEAAADDDVDKTEYCDCADDTDHADANDDFPGKSRSSTITLAFLIQKTNLTLEDAIVQVINIDISLTRHYELWNFAKSASLCWGHNLQSQLKIVNCDINASQVKSARTINPNLGFLTALVQLEESLPSKKNLWIRTFNATF